MERLLQWILLTLYPTRCPICGDIVIPKNRLVCKNCYERLPIIKEPMCKRCGKPLGIEEQEYCYDCTRKKFHYEHGYAVWVYNEVMKESIAAFKYKHQKQYANFYICELMKQYEGQLRKLKLDAIIPVPIHRKKKKIRGYNQAAVIANGIGKQLGIPVFESILHRVVNTKPQKELNDKERYQNLLHVFEVVDLKGSIPYLNNVLLVDDIYTTGSTIDACANVLKAAGVHKVYFVCLCIGKGY